MSKHIEVVGVLSQLGAHFGRSQ